MSAPPPSRTIAASISQLHGIGTALTDCATRLAYIRELLPQRGELVEEFRELVTTLAWIETTYRDTDERLLAAYRLLEHQERSTREGWKPIPLNGNGHP